MNAPFIVEREMLLPAKKDRQALVPCKDVEQRALDHTFDCLHSHGSVPAMQSIKIPVSCELMTNLCEVVVEVFASFLTFSAFVKLFTSCCSIYHRGKQRCMTSPVLLFFRHTHSLFGSSP